MGVSAGQLAGRRQERTVGTQGFGERRRAGSAYSHSAVVGAGDEEVAGGVERYAVDGTVMSWVVLQVQQHHTATTLA